MSSVDLKAVRAKLRTLSGSQQSIETLSLYFIHKKAQAKNFAAIWFEEIMAVPPDRKLCLLYLANDVLQRGRASKTNDYYIAFKECIGKAMVAVCTANIKLQPKVMRILTVWAERQVFPRAYIAKLQSAVQSAKTSNGSSKKIAASHVSEEALVDELRSAVTALKEQQQSDASAMQQVLALPNRLFQSETVATVTDADSGEALLQESDAANTVMASALGRIVAEYEDRQNIVRLLGKLVECQKSAISRASRLEQDCAKYRGVFEKAEEALRSNKDSSAARNTSDVNRLDMDMDEDNDDINPAAPPLPDSPPPPDTPAYPPTPVPPHPVGAAVPSADSRKRRFVETGSSAMPQPPPVNTGHPVYTGAYPGAIYGREPDNTAATSQQPPHPVPPHAHAPPPSQPVQRFPPGGTPQPHQPSPGFHSGNATRTPPFRRSPPPRVGHPDVSFRRESHPPHGYPQQAPGGARIGPRPQGPPFPRHPQAFPPAQQRFPPHPRQHPPHQGPPHGGPARPMAGNRLRPWEIARGGAPR
eukprot:m.25331 g.25331  ORF g.25331 m.25331 type:complete len:529 (-) comp13174_c0_seq1:155-1741(-)